MDLFGTPSSNLVAHRNLSTRFTASEAGFMLESSSSNVAHHQLQSFEEQFNQTLKEDQALGKRLSMSMTPEVDGASPGDHDNAPASAKNKYGSLYELGDASEVKLGASSDPSRPQMITSSHHRGVLSRARPRADMSEHARLMLMPGTGIQQDPLSGLKKKVVDLTSAKDQILRAIKGKEEHLKKLMQKVEAKNEAIKYMTSTISKARERLAERDAEARDLELKLREKIQMHKTKREENMKNLQLNKLHDERLKRVIEASKAAQREIDVINSRVGTLKAGLDVQLQGNQNLFQRGF